MAYGTLPIIGYHNLLEEGTTSGDGTDPENAYDWLTYDSWTTGAATGYIETTFGGAQTCDYMAFGIHDLHTQSATIKLQYWTGGAYADVPNATSTPTDGTAVLLCFPQQSATKYKVVVTTGGAAAYIGAISLGDRLDLERGCQSGYTPPELSYVDKVIGTRSQGGHSLGRSIINSGIAGKITLKNMTEAWTYTKFDAFVQHARSKAWFLLWNPDTYRDNAALCWTTPSAQITPTFSQPGFLDAMINYRGRVS